MYETPLASLPDGPFTASWDSLEQFSTPAWYRDAKFGIFIHWGVYSVPAFDTEWYPRNMYLKDHKAFEHHVKTWGPQHKFGYKDFIPMFTAPKFDPAEWVGLFKEAGAKYVMPVAEHHDGFAMYDSQLTRWNAKQMGPKRDVVGELAEATRSAGLVFGLSNHRAEHWWFMNGGLDFESDVTDPAYAEFYGPPMSMSVTPSREFKEDWLARCCELVDKYQPQLFYFDTWAERPPLQPYLMHFAAYYYNRAATWPLSAPALPLGAAINYKNSMYPPAVGVADTERGAAGTIRPRFWQSDTSVARNSWCHTQNNDYKSPRTLLHDLADVVSKNGTFLLNIGPKASGEIPDEDASLLRHIGKWLARNGEAIYSTRPWQVFGEGPTRVSDGHFTDAKELQYTDADFRFTTRGQKTLYAISMAAPAGKVLIRSLSDALQLHPQPVGRVELLGAGEVSWQRDAAGLHITLPDNQANVEMPVFKITQP